MKKKTFILCMLLIGLLGLCSCGSPSSGFKGNTQNAVKEQDSVVPQHLSVEELCPPEFEWTMLEPGFFQTTFKIKSLDLILNHW